MVIALCRRAVLGPISGEHSVDSASVYAGQTYDQWMIDALFPVTFRLATSR